MLGSKDHFPNKCSQRKNKDKKTVKIIDVADTFDLDLVYQIEYEDFQDYDDIYSVIEDVTTNEDSETTSDEDFSTDSKEEEFDQEIKMLGIGSSAPPATKENET